MKNVERLWAPALTELFSGSYGERAKHRLGVVSLQSVLQDNTNLSLTA